MTMNRINILLLLVVPPSFTSHAFQQPVRYYSEIKNVTPLQMTPTKPSSPSSSSSSSSSSRRDFLVSTGAITSGSLIPPQDSFAEDNSLITTAATTATTTPPTPLELPPIGLGAWAWGDSLFWGYDPKQDDDLRQVFNYALDKDLAFFDTAEIYGFGRSETLLGQFRSSSPPTLSPRVKIATKFAAFPWRTSPSSVLSACRSSLSRLGTNNSPPIDLYQIHFPNAWANEAYWDGLAQCYDQGLVKAVGVSNYGVDALRKIHSVLKKRGIPLATNQIQLSLLYKWPLENGLMNACEELGVKVLAYSPLALGFLTGKYKKDALPTGPRAKLGEELFKDEEGFAALLKEMEGIAAAKREGAVVSQVALNWCRAKGAIPIPGARNLKQCQQNLGSLDWALTVDEVGRLDELAGRVPALLSPDKSPFAKEDIGTGLKMFDS